MRVDATRLTEGLNPPNVSYGSSTGLLPGVPTLVWAIPQTGMHITIYPDEAWKFAQLQSNEDLHRRRLEKLAQDDAEANRLIAGWRFEGKSDTEIEQLLDDSPIEFDPTLENPALDIGAVTFDEWHLTGPSGSSWFDLNGRSIESDSAATLGYARTNASYFAWFGLTVAAQ